MVKKILPAFIIATTFVSCGQPNTIKYNESPSGLSIQSSSYQGVLSVPKQSCMGGVTTIEYNDSYYYVGLESSTGFLNLLKNFNGTPFNSTYCSDQYHINFTGNFGTQSSYYGSNPTSGGSPVINVQTFEIY